MSERTRCIPLSATLLFAFSGINACQSESERPEGGDPNLSATGGNASHAGGESDANGATSSAGAGGTDPERVEGGAGANALDGSSAEGGARMLDGAAGDAGSPEEGGMSGGEGGSSGSVEVPEGSVPAELVGIWQETRDARLGRRL